MSAELSTIFPDEPPSRSQPTSKPAKKKAEKLPAQEKLPKPVKEEPKGICYVLEKWL